jgi:hypothetical protein
MDRAAFARRVMVALLLTLLVAAAPASGASSVVVASGLNDPRGIDADDGRDGDRLLVAQSGSGEITEILAAKARPVVQPFATLPANPSPNDVVQHGSGSAFVTLSGGPPEGGGDPIGQLVRVPRGGDALLLADIAAYQVGDPDPVDQEGNPAESNPFGLALVRGGLLVVDAANNDLLKVEKDGSIETVARFPTRTASFPPGIPDGPPPGTPIEAESVPTAVAVGPDGAWYVSELRGFPFEKGTSRIWRIQPGTEEADCEPDAKRGPCRVFADGFTSVIDIAWADDTLLVLEIVKEGLLAAEAGTAPPIGALWAAENGSKTELVPGSLIAPGGVAVEDEDRIYVTTGTLLGAGAGEVVRIADALDAGGDDDDEDGRQGDDDDNQQREDDDDQQDDDDDNQQGDDEGGEGGDDGQRGDVRQRGDDRHQVDNGNRVDRSNTGGKRGKSGNKRKCGKRGKSGKRSKSSKKGQKRSCKSKRHRRV